MICPCFFSATQTPPISFESELLFYFFSISSLMIIYKLSYAHDSLSGNNKCSGAITAVKPPGSPALKMGGKPPKDAIAEAPQPGTRRLPWLIADPVL